MKKFLEFLKENDALDNFLDACPDMRTVPTSYISGSFTWSDTPQGFYYWEQLHCKWIKYLNSLSS